MPAELDLAVGGKRDEKDKETAQQIQQDIPPSEALCREVVCEQSRKLRISVTRIENGPALFSNMAWFLL